MFHNQLEALTAFASQEEFKNELLTAKAEYFSRTGEVYEDDPSFELRMASFLDYYLLDRHLGLMGKTPAQIFCEQPAASDEDITARRALTESIHSLWEVRKLGKEMIRLRNLFDGKDHDVYERRQPAGLKKGDLIEARLIPVQGKLLFSSAFCFHPEDAKKPVLKELKRLKKQQPDFDRRAFIWSLAHMRLKLDRYRNIAVQDIYAFDRKTI